MESNVPVSPYTIGPPIKDLDCFYGRRSQVNQFFNALRGRTLQPLRVLGLRRSGKTSFLLHLVHPEVAGPELENDVRPTIIGYVDLLASIKNPADFYWNVAEAIASAAPLALTTQMPDVPDDFPTFRSFRSWLRQLLAIGSSTTSTSGQTGPLRLVVLLDEFEVLAQSSEFDASFFHGLRALVTKFLNQFIWVTASCIELHTFAQHSDLASPFFNIFHITPIVIGPLEAKEIEELICDPAQKVGVRFLPSEINAIRDIAGLLPYFLQVAAERWFLSRKKGVSVDQCYGSVLKQLGDSTQIQHQIGWYWQQLTHQERACLYQAAQGRLDLGTHQDSVLKLLHFGLLKQTDGSLRVAGEVFRLWIEKHHIERRVSVDPSNVAPFVPIIVEATKFVFGEVSKWIDSVRKKANESLTSKTALDLPITEDRFLKSQTDLQAMAAMMSSLTNNTMAYDIQGLVTQIEIHHRNLADLEIQQTELGVHTPTYVKRGIEREAKAIVRKTERLVELLRQVYQKEP